MKQHATVEPEKARAAIERFCADFGTPFRDTWTMAEVAAYLSSLDYDANPGTVGEFIRKGYFICPDATALQVQDLYSLQLSLEARRRWKRAPSIHDMKKSAMRLRIEGTPGGDPVYDLDLTLEDLLLLIVQEQQPQMREALYECARLKLQGFEE